MTQKIQGIISFQLIIVLPQHSSLKTPHTWAKWWSRQMQNLALPQKHWKTSSSRHSQLCQNSWKQKFIATEQSRKGNLKMVGSHPNRDMSQSRLCSSHKNNWTICGRNTTGRILGARMKLKPSLHHGDQDRLHWESKRSSSTLSLPQARAAANQQAFPGAAFPPVGKGKPWCTSSCPSTVGHLLRVPIQSYVTGSALLEQLEAE